MSRLLEIHENYIKELVIFFSEEYVRLFYNKFKTKSEFQIIINEKIANALANYVNQNLISEYKIEVNLNFDLALRRDNIIESILNDADIKIQQPVFIDFYYKIHRFDEVKCLKICIK
jgi:hypothetical protein